MQNKRDRGDNADPPHAFFPSDRTVCAPAPFTNENSSKIPVPAKKQNEKYSTISFIILAVFIITIKADFAQKLQNPLYL